MRLPRRTFRPSRQAIASTRDRIGLSPHGIGRPLASPGIHARTPQEPRRRPVPDRDRGADRGPWIRARFAGCSRTTRTDVVQDVMLKLVPPLPRMRVRPDRGATRVRQQDRPVRVHRRMAPPGAAPAAPPTSRASTFPTRPRPRPCSRRSARNRGRACGRAPGTRFPSARGRSSSSGSTKASASARSAKIIGAPHGSVAGGTLARSRRSGRG